MNRAIRILKSNHPRSIHQKKPFIIPIFLPHIGCPHRCVFCNQSAITGTRRRMISSKQFRARVTRFLAYKGEQRDPVQIAFYGGNFLGQRPDQITYLLNEATQFVCGESVDSIRFSTRPDTITPEQLDILKGYPVRTIELGVQSMDDQVLTAARRGHTASDTETAVHLLREQNYETGLQIMIGLPGDDETGALLTAVKIADLLPDFVRIYPTLVLKGSLLAKWYSQGKYMPLSLQSSIGLVKKLFLFFFEKQIPVVRMGLQASDPIQNDALLAGPYHPAFGHLVYSDILLDIVSSHLNQEKSKDDPVSIRLHPRNTSRLRGLNNQNIDRLEKAFRLKTIQIVSDPLCPTDRLLLDGHPIAVPF